jgi:hypothetical protein
MNEFKVTRKAGIEARHSVDHAETNLAAGRCVAGRYGLLVTCWGRH